MFSKISIATRAILTNSKFYFTPKRNLKDKMRTETFSFQKDKKSREYSHFQIGMYGLVFALCFAAIPMYRIFCEHVGLVGNNDKKVYDFKDKQIVNHKKYLVKFQGFPQPGINWEFEPIEKEVIVGASETAIIFYRLRNKEKRAIVGFSTYNIAPEEANVYFSKIQCFCFNQQMVNSEEELLLPLFFYLEPEINEDDNVSRIKEVTVNYQFYESNNQDLAKFAEEEFKRIEENKKKLNEIRAKKMNLSLEDYEDHILEKEIEINESIPQIETTMAQQISQGTATV